MVDAVRLVVGQAGRRGGGGARDRAHAGRRRHGDGHGSAALRRQRRARRGRPPRPGRDRDLRADLQRARARACCAPRGSCSSRRSTPPTSLPGALRLAPVARRSGHRGGAARECAGGQRASRSSSQRSGAATAFATELAAAAPAVGHRSRGRHRRVHDAAPRARWTSSRPGASRSWRWRDRPAPGRPTCCARSPRCRTRCARRSSLPQAFETLAFLAEAGAAAEGVRVISRFVPSRAARRERAQLRRRLRRSPRAAAAGRDLRGGGRRRRARGREDGGREDGSHARGAGEGAARAAGPRRPARPLGREPERRHHAAPPGGAHGRRRRRSAPSGWSPSRSHCPRPER